MARAKSTTNGSDLPDFHLDDIRAAEVAEETMVGDLRDLTLSMMRGNLATKGWSHLTEAEQRMIADHVEDRVRKTIKLAVEIIATGENPVIRGTVDSVRRKGGITATVKIAPAEENRHELFDADGGMCFIILANPSPYLGSGDEPEIDEDQPILPGTDAEDHPPV